MRFLSLLLWVYYACVIFMDVNAGLSITKSLLMLKVQTVRLKNALFWQHSVVVITYVNERVNVR